MPKAFYEEFALYAWKSYFDSQPPILSELTPAQKKNLQACSEAYNEAPALDRDILAYVFGSMLLGSGTRLTESVKEAARHAGISDKTVWKIISRAERKFAQKRGLL